MTGFGGRRVMIDRGGFFFPIIQRYVPVSLETMKLEFELQKLKVEALRDVQAELARSIGQFMSKGNMNIYGDPATLAKMTEQYTKGLGVGNFLDGISTGSNGQSTELIQQILELVQGLANRSGISTDKNPPSNN